VGINAFRVSVVVFSEWDFAKAGKKSELAPGTFKFLENL
jgi:hypothetical protein